MDATMKSARLRLHLPLAALVLATLATLATPAAASSVARQEFLSALERGDTDGAARLVTAGVDIDAQRSDGKTLLILAAKQSDVVLVRRLIAAGANVNATTDNGGTALMFAAIGGDLETQSVLIEAGADVNAIGGFHWTALMVASVKGHTLAVRQLLARGADPNLRDVYGWTPLMRAVYEARSRVVQALMEHPNVDLNAKNDQGATALHLAAVKGNEDLARVLLLGGANPLIEDRSGRTPAMTALAAGHDQVAELLANRSSQ
jgi:ankyrin repeat protein